MGRQGGPDLELRRSGWGRLAGRSLLPFADGARPKGQSVRKDALSRGAPFRAGFPLEASTCGRGCRPPILALGHTVKNDVIFTVPTDPSTSPHNPRPSSARPAAFYQGPLLQVRTPPQHEDRRNVYPQQERG
jgi:hypothetical protein